MPEPAPSPARLAAPAAIDDLLLYRIARVLAAAGGMVIRLCEGRFGITRREWSVLALVAKDEGLLSSQLAEHAQLDRARTSRAISSLVAKKLVRRGSLPADRRQAPLWLTEAGRALYEEMFPLVVELNGDLLSVLGDAGVVRLDAALDLLQRHAETLAAAAELPKADRRKGGRAPRATG